MASSNATVGFFPATPHDEQPVPKTKTQGLVNSLRSNSEITEESRYSSPSRAVDLRGYARDDAAEGSRFRTDIEDLRTLVDKAQWNDFLRFMEMRATERPYPKYLYRAHIHGHPIPRVVDENTREYCDSFGSDIHRWREYDAGMEIDIPMCEPTEELTLDDVFEDLRQHLNKTQINLQREAAGQELFLSQFVSLSGDFRWTLQRTCRIGRQASEGFQIPGLAIFETSGFKSSGVHVWRVRDMLDFLDNSTTWHSVNIPPRLRGWATNADEYVSWDLVPREAFVSFTSLHQLTQEFESGDGGFLRKEFAESTYLSDFRQRPRKALSLEEYTGRVSRFVRNIISSVSSSRRMEIGLWDVDVLGQWFCNPFDWGYNVAGFAEDLDEIVVSSIEAALGKASAR